MSTGSLVIDANQTGNAYTGDLNTALSAINTCHSGITAPTEDIATGKFWVDTSGANPVLKIYRNGWRTLFTLKTSSVDISADTITAVNFNTTSDARLKSNISTIENASEKVNSLRGVTFTMNEKDQIGLIAQEVEAVIPQLVSTDELGFKSVAYANMVGMLIEAFKEQQAQIESLEEKVKCLLSEKDL